MNKIFKIWNKQDKINGVDANVILATQPFCAESGDIILISNENTPERVTNIECKSILASIFDIDINLNIDDFMKEYFEKIEIKVDLEN